MLETPPPPPQTTPTFDMFEIKKSEQGNRGLYWIYIDSHCPYLLFGETTFNH